MVKRSFPLVPASGLVPRRRWGKQPALVVAALAVLAGCGGDSPAEPRTVQGNGFSVSVPGDWQVQAGARRLAAEPSAAAAERVEVATFRLARRYRPRLWPRVVPELDSVAAQLARRLGEDAARSPGRTEVIAARRARVYDIAYSRGEERRVERVAFVLDARREYQLLCRWNADEPDEGEAACTLLFSSFRLA